MKKENKNTGNPYLDNTELWKVWQQRGVNQSTPLLVDFEFSALNLNLASKFHESLNNPGFKRVEVRLLDKIWKINLTMLPRTWNCNKLDQQAKVFHEVAQQFGCSLTKIDSTITELEIAEKNIDNPYLNNEDLWENWRRNGISETTPLEVDFEFIGQTQKAAREFTGSLKKSGYNANFQENQGKEMWDVHLSMPRQTWTLEKLNQHANKFHQEAVEYDCLLDGLGALLPPM